MNDARLLRSSLAVALIVGAGSVLVAPSATANPGAGSTGKMIGVSSDGRTWSHALTEPLFDPAVRWVPGDVRAARFYVRNQAEGDGQVQVSFSPTISVSQVEEEALEVVARAGDRPWTRVTAGETDDLLARGGLPVGASVPVDLRVRMRYDAANTTMRLRTGMKLDVTISDALAGAEPGGTGPVTDGGHGLLPQTGFALTPWHLLGAAVSVLVGAWLLFAGRRRREEQESPRPPRGRRILLIPPHRQGMS